MNKLEIFCSNSTFDLEKDVLEFAEEHNIINVVFYTVEDMYFKKRAMVIYSDNEFKRQF